MVKVYAQKVGDCLDCVIAPDVKFTAEGYVVECDSLVDTSLLLVFDCSKLGSFLDVIRVYNEIVRFAYRKTTEWASVGDRCLVNGNYECSIFGNNDAADLVTTLQH